MAVPSVGALSLLGIRNEIGDDNYSSGTSRTNISLKDLSDGSVETINSANASSDRPDGSAPHAMSEFYAYDHDKVGATYTSVFNNFTLSETQGQTDTSSAKGITITGGSGSTTVHCATGLFGDLKVALAASSGGPFSNHATSDSIAHSSGTIYAQFKYTANHPIPGGSGSDTRTITITNDSGASASATITVQVEGA